MRVAQSGGDAGAPRGEERGRRGSSIASPRPAIWHTIRATVVTTPPPWVGRAPNAALAGPSASRGGPVAAGDAAPHEYPHPFPHTGELIGPPHTTPKTLRIATRVGNLSGGCPIVRAMGCEVAAVRGSCVPLPRLGIPTSAPTSHPYCLGPSGCSQPRGSVVDSRAVPLVTRYPWHMPFANPGAEVG